MTVRVGPLELRNPVILASGLRGDSPANLRAAYDAGAGAVVTKSVTLKPREGYPEPNFVKAAGGGWLNSIGLRNDGAQAFSRSLGRPDFPVIVSLAGSEPGEYAVMVGLFKHAAAFELNLSCPSVEGFGRHVGDDPDFAARAVRETMSTTESPVFVKIAHHMRDSAAMALEAGAAGVTAINTVPAMDIDIETGRPALSNSTGGLSGPPIRTIALETVRELAALHDAPIIGCGGISRWQDAAAFFRVGATAVQVGSAAMEDLNVLGEIAAGLSSWTQ